MSECKTVREMTAADCAYVAGQWIKLPFWALFDRHWLFRDRMACMFWQILRRDDKCGLRESKWAIAKGKRLRGEA